MCLRIVLSSGSVCNVQKSKQSARKRMHSNALPHAHFASTSHRVQTGSHGVKLVRDVRYGDTDRNLLDIYTPRYEQHWWQRRRRKGEAPTRSNLEAAPAPVVLSVHGGVWTSGERWHYTLLARSLAEEGAVVCVMAYSAYPVATVDTMVRTQYFIQQRQTPCSLITDALIMLASAFTQQGKILTACQQ